MRLQELDSGLLHSYGEPGPVRGADPGSNVYATSTSKQTSQAHVGKTGDGSSDQNTAPVSEKEIRQAAEELQKRMEEQGVHLKFEVMHAEDGQIEVEVTDEDRSKVLMRIPPKGVLRINAQGKTAIGNFLNLRS
ncbi:MAG: flagellar protein FlaG [Halodesulfovibrio sp.]